MIILLSAIELEKNTCTFWFLRTISPQLRFLKTPWVNGINNMNGIDYPLIQKKITIPAATVVDGEKENQQLENKDGFQGQSSLPVLSCDSYVTRLTFLITLKPKRFVLK